MSDIVVWMGLRTFCPWPLYEAGQRSTLGWGDKAGQSTETLNNKRGLLVCLAITALHSQVHWPPCTAPQRLLAASHKQPDEWDCTYVALLVLQGLHHSLTSPLIVSDMCIALNL